MNSRDSPRRHPKKRRTAITKSLSLLPDLNSPPVEGAPEEGSLSSVMHISHTGASSSMPVAHNQASSSMPAPHSQATSSIPGPQSQASNSMSLAANVPHIGMHGLPIDVEAIDDDVVIYSSRSPPQARQQVTRTLVVILDDDSETSPEQAGDTLDEHVNTLLSLGINRRHEPPRVTNNCPVISLVDTPEAKIFKEPPQPVKEVPKEPKFTCPICMNELTEATSTHCGHIFCQKCIKAAIQAQKKCPTCRKKLGMSQQHRVYLPTTE